MCECMEGRGLYVLVIVCECLVGIYVHMYLFIHTCLCIYLHTRVCVFMSGGRSKGVNSEFLVETVSTCVRLNTYVKGYVCLFML